MDEGKRHLNPNPWLKANILSKLFFVFVGPFLQNGYKKFQQNESLGVEDMWNVLPDDGSERLCRRLEGFWEEELKGRKEGREPSLRRAIKKLVWKTHLLCGLGVLIEETSKVLQPIFMGKLIQYFIVGSGVSRLSAYMYGLGVSMATLFALAHHPAFFNLTRNGMKMRVACCALMYKKALKLSPAAFHKTTTGQIVNLMTNDVVRFDMALNMTHHFWIGPLQVLIVSIILWLEVGAASLAGFSLLILLIPFQMVCGRLFALLRRKVAVQTDERVKIMNEVLTGMRVIKMYCWENLFVELIRKTRLNEVKKIRLASLARATSTSPFFASAKVITFLTVVTYVMTGHTLDASTVFVVVGLYNPVRLTVTLGIPWGIQLMSEALISVQRIQDFLLMEERVLPVQPSIESPPPEKCQVIGRYVSCKWEEEQASMTLNNINFEVKAGELLAVVGPVGSGKSSLLMAILGELPLSDGNIKVDGRVAYASQQPWIFSASVRQNITFGEKFDEARYKIAIKAAALSRDLDIMPDGEQTLIGDRGASLSGGQKARISLARALYYKADVYLLDDPLSAVDPAVGKHIFEKCICGVLRKKPRILVTHQLQFLPKVDRILIIDGGEVLGLGSYDELVEKGIDFNTLLKDPSKETPRSSPSPSPDRDITEYRDKSEKNGNVLEEGYSGESPLIPKGTKPEKRLFMSKMTKAGSRQSLSKSRQSLSKSRESLSKSRESLHGSVANLRGSMPHLSTSMISLATLADTIQPDFVAPVQEEEKRSAGTIGALMYLKYIYSGFGIIGFIVFSLLNIGAQGMYIVSDWWLAYWANQEDHRAAQIIKHQALMAELGHNNTNVTIPQIDNTNYVYIYTGITLGVFIFGILRAQFVFLVFVQAAMKLHNKMFAAIIRCPIKFFDDNPVGRILNRFSKDIGIVDEIFPNVMNDTIMCFLLVLAVLIVTCAVNPWILLPTLAILVLFVFMRRYYLATSRSVKRLEATARSPIYSHLSASLQGIHSIRAYQMQTKFEEEFYSHQDLHSEAWMLFLMTVRWLAIRLDVLCFLFITAVTFGCLIAEKSMNAGLAGLAISTSFGLLGVFQWLIRQSSEAENHMTSVERLVEYSELEPEAPLDSSEELKPPDDWPTHGIISGEDIKFRYSKNMNYVLKGLRFCIRAQEKVGVVGRTGAGKSSLISMLFRMFEPEGKLLIDGIDATTLGLHDLRSKISIIPQEPVLFTGSVKRNLDPFKEQDENKLLEALAEVQLKTKIDSLAGGLDAEISEGGDNFSVGERQLICLARAILKQNRILIIDEATANVDPHTDNLIQKTIREKFKDCTVITIAHRLNTIMDSDRIMVMDEGKIIEFDEPYLLMKDETSVFLSMVKQTGPEQTEKLKQVAEEAHIERANKNDNDLLN